MLNEDFYKNLRSNKYNGSTFYKTFNRDMLGNELTLYTNPVVPPNRFVDTTIMQTEPKDIRRQNPYFQQSFGVANPPKTYLPKRNLGSFLTESVDVVDDTQTGGVQAGGLGEDDRLRKPKNLTGVSGNPVLPNSNTGISQQMMSQPETNTSYRSPAEAQNINKAFVNAPQKQISSTLQEILGVTDTKPAEIRSESLPEAKSLPQSSIQYNESGLVNHLGDWSNQTYNASLRSVNPSIQPASAPKVVGVLSSQFPVSQGDHAGWGYKALDIATPVGTPLRSPKNGGVVTMTSAYNGEAHITYPDGSKVIFMHMSKMPALGSTVNAGDLVGATGNVGRSDGAHLHMEYFENGRYVSPAGLLY